MNTSEQLNLHRPDNWTTDILSYKGDSKSIQQVSIDCLNIIVGMQVVLGVLGSHKTFQLSVVIWLPR
jgi:hypothetical protein